MTERSKGGGGWKERRESWKGRGCRRWRWLFGAENATLGERCAWDDDSVARSVTSVCNHSRRAVSKLLRQAFNTELTSWLQPARSQRTAAWRLVEGVRIKITNSRCQWPKQSLHKLGPESTLSTSFRMLLSNALEVRVRTHMARRHDDVGSHVYARKPI